MKNKRMIIMVFIIIGITVAGFLVWKSRNNTTNSRQLNREVAPRMVMTVEKGDIQKTISASGYLSPQ
ncbi:MAG TPA: hypothetical protein DEB05_10915, partial [Firmicutes bacterium]|nr:hypothetical protein [Bacillota bacterium]